MKEKEEKPFYKQLPKPLVRSLEKAQDYLGTHPNSYFDMQSWGYMMQNHECHTVGCIAGIMYLCSGPKAEIKHAIKEETLYLQTDGEQGRHGLLGDRIEAWKNQKVPKEFRTNFDNLFSSVSWPHNLRTKKGNITNKKAIQRIDYFLQTGL